MTHDFRTCASCQTNRITSHRQRNATYRWSCNIRILLLLSRCSLYIWVWRRETKSIYLFLLAGVQQNLSDPRFQIAFVDTKQGCPGVLVHSHTNWPHKSVNRPHLCSVAGVSIDHGKSNTTSHIDDTYIIYDFLLVGEMMISLAVFSYVVFVALIS